MTFRGALIRLLDPGCVLIFLVIVSLFGGFGAIIRCDVNDAQDARRQIVRCVEAGGKPLECEKAME